MKMVKNRICCPLKSLKNFNQLIFFFLSHDTFLLVWSGRGSVEKGDVTYFYAPIGIQHHHISATRGLSIQVRPTFIDLMTQSVKTKELIKAGRVVTSQNHPVRPDCGAGCMEVSGRCVEKHFNPTYCRRLTHFRDEVNYWFLPPNNNILIKRGRSDCNYIENRSRIWGKEQRVDRKMTC